MSVSPATLQILDDLAYHKIQTWTPPMYENDDAETFQENKEIVVSPLRYNVRLCLHML